MVFSEFPDLTDASIAQFVKVTAAIDGIHDHSLRGNAMGMFQANLGLWQILARQGEIPRDDLNNSWQQAIAPFAAVSSSAQLFDAGHTSLATLMKTAGGKSNLSQAEFIALLAGPAAAICRGSAHPRRNGRPHAWRARRSAPGIARQPVYPGRRPQQDGAGFARAAGNAVLWPANCASSNCPGRSLPRAKKQSGRPASTPTGTVSYRCTSTSPR